MKVSTATYGPRCMVISLEDELGCNVQPYINIVKEHIQGFKDMNGIMHPMKDRAIGLKFSEIKLNSCGLDAIRDLGIFSFNYKGRNRSLLSVLNIGIYDQLQDLGKTRKEYSFFINDYISEPDLIKKLR